MENRTTDAGGKTEGAYQSTPKGGETIAGIREVHRPAVLDYVAVALNGGLLLVGLGGVVLALKSVNSLRSQTQVLIDNERAWLSLTMGDQVLPMTGNPVYLWWIPTVVNHGKNPAVITKMYCRLQIIPKSEQLPEFPDYKETEDYTSSVFSGELLIVPAIPLSPVQVRMDYQFARQVRARVTSLYIYGYVAYNITTRAKSIERSTRFCFVYHVPDQYDPIQKEGFMMPAALREYTRAT